MTQFPSIHIKNIIFNPRDPNIMYSVSVSEVNPHTKFKPIVLRNYLDEHTELFKKEDPGLIRGYNDDEEEAHYDNIDPVEVFGDSEDPFEMVMRKRLKTMKDEI